MRAAVSSMPLTLLSAPAGYGKTTMMAAIPELLPTFKAAWVTLDAEDNDPARFLGLLTASLQQLHPEFGTSVWPWITGGMADSASLKRAVGALINDVLRYLTSPFILVLDDLHFVSEPAVYVAIEYLLDHQPAQMHIVIGTRQDPPLRLAKLAARRQLAELRRLDLSFSVDEADQLLNNSLGLKLSQADVTDLQERTEGWPAGLCLLAGPLGRMSTSADRNQFMAAITHNEQFALDFLAEEVLRDLPDDLRLFLMQTAILSEMTPSICRMVTGRDDAIQMLERLYKQNLTIACLSTAADGEPVYRHHALFARLLCRQLEREHPGTIVDLHRRAAAAQKTPGRAIAHFLAADLWDDAAKLMEQSGMLLLHQGMAETVRKWHNSLPEATRLKYPHLMVIIGRCEIHRGDYDAAVRHLTQAKDVFVALGDKVGEGEALTSLITIAMQNNDHATIAVLVKRASQLPLGPLGQVAMRLARALLQVSAGAWDDAYTDIKEALSIPHVTGNRQADLIGITYMSAAMAAVPKCIEITERYCAEASALALPGTAWRLGANELAVWPLIWRGQVTEAQAQAESAEESRRCLGGYPFVGADAAAELCVIYLAKGDLTAAGQAVDTLVQRIQHAPGFKLMFFLHAAGRTLLQLGRRSEAQAMLQRLVASDNHRFTQYLVHHLSGLLALHGGERSTARKALERAAQLEAELPITWVGGSATLLQARLLLDEGHADQAVALVDVLLSGWQKDGTLGRALLDGLTGLPVLRLAAQRGNTVAAEAVALFGAHAEAAGGGADCHNASAMVSGRLSTLETLTQRECDVLRLIVAGRTNQQIGDELYITKETVKSHVVRILRKLDVTSRTQAAIKGRELGL